MIQRLDSFLRPALSCAGQAPKREMKNPEILKALLQRNLSNDRQCLKKKLLMHGPPFSMFTVPSVDIAHDKT
jgi:hypothetical protein